MRRASAGLVALASAIGIACGAATYSLNADRISPQGAISSSKSTVLLHEKRSSPLDLEIGGDLAGAPAGTTHYLTREDLLSFPQVNYLVSDDTNFPSGAKVSGVELSELARRLGATPETDMVIAVCDDKYRAHYPQWYLAAHKPLLVLEVNGQAPDGWPKDPEEGSTMGPYMVSHPQFAPSFHVLAHADEAQIPWGVIRLEFRDEKTVLGSIAPRGVHATDAAVQAGYRIAQQNCFRCHNMGAEGGLKAGLPWTALASFAAASPQFFANYVRDPKSQNPRTQMASSPGYDDATMVALEAYFQTFVAQGAAQKITGGPAKSSGQGKP